MNDHKRKKKFRLTHLQRKLVRDLWHLRGQVAAIALVVACGVASFVSMRSTYDSLLATQTGYYAKYRFSDVFLQLKRAPQSMAERVKAISGISAVQIRIVDYVTVDLPDITEPAQARIVSIPENKKPILNDLHLLSGRYIEPQKHNEILISGGFAESNDFGPGDTVTVILNGRLKRLHIVGTALSPEFVYEIRPGDIFPDNKRFGIIWMNEKSVSAAFQMEGAFNDLTLSLSPEADEDEVVKILDDVFENYGGLGAFKRSEQYSHRFLDNEIAQQKIFGTAVPAIFLGVVAFLLHLVLSRLVNTQRDQIAVLKAFGYENKTIGLHYLQLALGSVFGGVVLGLLLGAWLGSAMTTLYGGLFRFPVLVYELNPSVIIISFLISFSAAAMGALSAVRKSVSLPPAEAMRPEPPDRFDTGLFERISLRKYMPPAVRMILRSIMRHPIKSLLSIVGISASVALLFVGFYFFDAINRILEVQFDHVMREDAGIVFTRPLPGSVKYELEGLPAVKRVETFRTVPARIKFGHRSRRVGILGLPPDSALRKIVDEHFYVKRLEPEGLILSQYLADILQVKPGDLLEVEIKEGNRPTRRIAVVQTVSELIGLNAYMDIDALHRMMREEDTVSGAFLSVEAQKADELYAKLKARPNVATVSLPKVARQSFEETFAESIGTSTLILVLFAAVIAFGVIYNGARIALSERGREFASLRVLGYTQGEVAMFLLGEQAILTAAAVPLGYVFGIFLSSIMNAAVDVELLRLPIVFSAQTFIFSFLIVLATALLSGLLVAWRLRNLDMIEVLKTRE